MFYSIIYCERDRAIGTAKESLIGPSIQRSYGKALSIVWRYVLSRIDELSLRDALLKSIKYPEDILSAKLCRDLLSKANHEDEKFIEDIVNWYFNHQNNTQVEAFWRIIGHAPVVYD